MSNFEKCPVVPREWLCKVCNAFCAGCKAHARLQESVCIPRFSEVELAGLQDR